METVTCSAPVNIAVVKYWGKRNEELVIPTNSSLSATLGQDQLRAKTTVTACASFKKDRLWLNGREESVDNPRIKNVLSEVRKRSRKPERTQFVHICSENNFPTAAGLASSAAGYACLVYSLAKLFDVQGDISELARRGSGSACRSVYGGFVEWDMGQKADGSDSLARQVVTESHWPELRVLILVVSGKQKPIGSTAGMQNTVKTSELLQQRINNVVPQRIELMKTAIFNKDFITFAELTMKDSNQMHAVCLDTFPPIIYMTDTSRDIIHLMTAINSFYGTNKVGYTFDAGPNACLYLLEKDVPLVAAAVKHFFPPSQENGDCFVKGIQLQSEILDESFLSSVPLQPKPGGIQYIISTKVGDGPRVLPKEESLLGPDGLPVCI